MFFFIKLSIFSIFSALSQKNIDLCAASNGFRCEIPHDLLRHTS